MTNFLQPDPCSASYPPTAGVGTSVVHFFPKAHRSGVSHHDDLVMGSSLSPRQRNGGREGTILFPTFGRLGSTVLSSFILRANLSVVHVPQVTE
jgi:hypothetical protein